MTVLITEDDVTGYPQANYYNDDPASPFYHQGNPINDFSHQHVVRAFLTPVFGDVIAPGNTGPGGNQCFSYSVTIPAAWKPAKLNAVAIVNGYGASADGKPILNVQSTPLGEGISWAE